MGRKGIPVSPQSFLGGGTSSVRSFGDELLTRSRRTIAPFFILGFFPFFVLRVKSYLAVTLALRSIGSRTVSRAVFWISCARLLSASLAVLKAHSWTSVHFGFGLAVAELELAASSRPAM